MDWPRSETRFPRWQIGEYLPPPPASRGEVTCEVRPKKWIGADRRQLANSFPAFKGTRSTNDKFRSDLLQDKSLAVLSVHDLHSAKTTAIFRYT